MRRQPLLPVRRVGRERSLVRALGSADGFGLIETVIALSIFAIVSVSVMGLLTGSINSVSLARQKTLAEQVAASELESIRADASTTSGYANDLGTVNGKPGGIYPNMQYNLSANGLTYNEQIQISWVNDPAPTAYTSYADYKQVTVTILRSSDSKVLTRQTTYVSPGNTSNYGGSSDGIAKAQVIDMGNNTPVAGVSVALTGPGAPQSDTTDATGTVMFPALPATSGSQYYTFAVTPPYGYVNLSDDVSPSTASHFQLVGGQTFSTALRVYRPATVYVNVLSDGVTYPGTATVTLTSSEPTQTINWNGAASPLTGVVSGLQYTATAKLPDGLTSTQVVQTVPNAYPTNLTSTFNLTVPNLWVTVKKKVSSTCQTVSNATVTVSRTGFSTLTGTTNSSGLVGFSVPGGGASYSVKATSGSNNNTVTQAVATAPATTQTTVSVSGTCT